MKKIKEVFLARDYNDGINFIKAVSGYVDGCKPHQLIKTDLGKFIPPEYKLYSSGGKFIRCYSENDIKDNLKTECPLFKVFWENICKCGCGCEHCGTKKCWELPIPELSILKTGFIISGIGDIFDGVRIHNIINSYKIGNWFSTKEAAERRVKQLKAITYCNTLRDYCNEKFPIVSNTAIYFHNFYFRNYDSKQLFIELCDQKIKKYL